MSCLDEIGRLSWGHVTKIKFPPGFKPSPLQMEALTRSGMASGGKFNSLWVEQKARQLQPAMFREFFAMMMFEPVLSSLIDEVTAFGGTSSYPTYAELTHAVDTVCAKWDPAIVRLVLVSILDDEFTTAKRASLQVLCNHPSLRLEGFPNIRADVTSGHMAEASHADALVALGRITESLAEGRRPLDSDMVALRRFTDMFDVIAGETPFGNDPSVTLAELIDALPVPEPRVVDPIDHETLAHVLACLESVGEPSADTMNFVDLCRTLVSNEGIAATDEQMVFLAELCELLRLVRLGTDGGDPLQNLRTRLKELRASFPAVVLMYVEGGFATPVPGHVTESVTPAMQEPPSPAPGVAETADESTPEVPPFEPKDPVQPKETVREEPETPESESAGQSAPVAPEPVVTQMPQDGTGGTKRSNRKRPAPEPEQPAAPVPTERGESSLPQEAGDAAVLDEKVIIELMGQGRLGLARAVAITDTRYSDLAELLSVAVLQSESWWTQERNPVLTEAERLFGRLDLAAARRNPLHRALSEVVAVCGALQTGFPQYLNSLHLIANETDHAPTAELFRAVAQLPFGGQALSTEAGRTAIAVNAREQAVKDAAEFAQKAPSKNLKYYYALVAWKDLTQPTGRIGKVIRIVANDDASKIDQVKELIEALKDPDEVMEDALRQIPNVPRGTQIQFGARDAFLRYLSEPDNILRRWVAGVDAEKNAEVTDYREDPREFARRLDSLISHIVKQAPPGYRHALESTIETIGLRSGRRESTVDLGIRPDDVLGYEIDAEISIPDGEDGHASTAAGDLLRARSASERPHALESARVLFHSGQFLRASRVLAVVRSRGTEIDEDTEQTADWAERDLAAARDSAVQELRALLGQARALDTNLELSDNDASVILSEIEIALMVSGTDLVGAVKVLREKIGEIKERLDGACVELRANVDAILESGRISALSAEQMHAAIDRYNIRAVVYRMWRLNEGLGDSSVLADEFGLMDFFFNIVNAASGIEATQRSVAAVSRGGKLGGIEFPGFGEDPNTEESRALNSWITLKSLSARDRTIENVRTHLPAVLRMIGLEGRRIERARDEAAGPGRLWVDLQEVDRSGRAMLPSFGSQMQDRTIRLLVQFDEVTPKRLIEVVNLDRSGRQILVVYFGSSLTKESRHTLASLCRRQNLLAPVLDWPLMLEMVRKPDDSRFERFIHLAAPFSWTNPYVPNVQGRVPLELFYGRSEEVTKVLDPRGPTFVYGGRQLGKSALLRRSAVQIEEREANAVGIYIDMNYHSVGAARPPERVWELIADELEKREDRGFEPNARLKGFERVENMVTRWLEQDGTRRLLILLDECDRMLTQDMNSHYGVSNQIRGIIESTNRRCKIVLAGLNSVQRRYKGFDHPMAHLAGEAIEVGPLRGADAFRLVSEPLNVIGLRFSEEDAFGIDMILTATNDQPSLIQLVCHRLVEQVKQSPMKRDLSNNVIAQSTIEAVLMNQDTQDDLRKRFEWTIDLDHRYKAIAYRVVLQLKEKDRPNMSGALYSMCKQDYPNGFENCSLEEFRWYLDELRTFGILQKTSDDKWMLRSPNIATMFGPYEEVEERLRKLADATPYEDMVPAHARARVGDGLSPLALDQHQKIGEEFQGPRFVVASTMMGGESVRAAFEMTASELSLDFAWVDRDGDPDPLQAGGGALTVVDIRSWDSAATAGLVSRAVESRVPGRTIVVLRPSQAFALDPEDERVIHMRTWDENSLRWWFGSENIAYADHDLEKILGITGGCHSIVDAVVRRGPQTMQQFIGQCEEEARARHENGFGIVSSGTEIDDARNVLDLLVEGDSQADFVDLFPGTLITVMRHAGMLGGTSRGLVPMKRLLGLLN